jgi:DNA-binding transcriptional regulator YhcF (GntR family)
MKIRLDRSRRESLLVQARDQIISGLHAGLLRDGDRLPSLRRVAALSGLNVKTVLRVYAALRREGLVTLRKGSGAFVTVSGQEEIEPPQAVSLARLLRRHLDEASGVNVSPLAYTALVRRLVTRSSLRGRSVAVLECNDEQLYLYASEIRQRIGVEAHPISLARVSERATASLLRSVSVLAVTDFHFKEGAEIARRFGKARVRLRLRRDFLPALMGAARQGRLLMVVSNTEFFPAFKRALGLLGLQRECLDRIAVVAGTDNPGLRRAVVQADTVYVSPLCPPDARALVATPCRLLEFSHHLSDESVEELEAWLLLSSGDGVPARGWPA